MEIDKKLCDTDRNEKLRFLVKDIIAQGFVPIDMTGEFWEFDLLEQVCLTPNRQIFVKRVLQVNTAKLYK
ncbi:hypothetical protein BGX28_010449 [Mortierella sp. GBA30]|nr:hypothetical protein BGX28_010449 [Mortierella sp. GBA30]